MSDAHERPEPTEWIHMGEAQELLGVYPERVSRLLPRMKRTALGLRGKGWMLLRRDVEAVRTLAEGAGIGLRPAARTVCWLRSRGIEVPGGE